MTKRSSHHISLTAATAVSVIKLTSKKIFATCVTLVTASRNIGQVIKVFCETQVIRIGKAVSKTVNVLSVAVVTILRRFFLPVIRTPIFGRATSPLVVLGEDRIARISGRTSTVRIDGKAEPEE